MTENSKKLNLSDEALKAVNGGGSGSVPREGIIKSGYVNIEAGHYYSDNSMKTVVYVYNTIASGSWADYTVENFSVSGDSWSSSSTPGTFSDNKETFMGKYPFILNVTP